MIKVWRVLYGDHNTGGHYYKMSITSGRETSYDRGSVVEPAEYAIDDHPVSAEVFRDAIALLSLPTVAQ